MAAVLSRVVLFVRDVPRAAAFLEAVGCRAHLLQGGASAVAEAGPVPLVLQQAPSEAHASTGYSPLLTLSVSGLAELVPRLLVEHGAALDGAIEHGPTAAVATLRGPCGHMYVLVEEHGTDAAGGGSGPGGGAGSAGGQLR